MKYTISLLCCIFGLLNAHAQTADSTDKKTSFNYVEHMPVPSVNINEYLSKNLKYPNSARKKGIEGRVLIRFVVNSTGQVDSVKLLKGIDEKCDEEAMRVISEMPDWTPGMQNGKNVNVYFTLPINFKLDDDTHSLGSRKKKKGLPH